MPRAPRLLLCLLAFAAFAPASPRVARAEAEESGLSAGSGPRVKLDQLRLPPDLIGAKAQHADQSRWVVEAKAEVERLREIGRASCRERV